MSTAHLSAIILLHTHLGCENRCQITSKIISIIVSSSNSRCKKWMLNLQKLREKWVGENAVSRFVQSALLITSPVLCCPPIPPREASPSLFLSYVSFWFARRIQFCSFKPFLYNRRVYSSWSLGVVCYNWVASVITTLSFAFLICFYCLLLPEISALSRL